MLPVTKCYIIVISVVADFCNIVYCLLFTTFYSKILVPDKYSNKLFVTSIRVERGEVKKEKLGDSEHVDYKITVIKT